jgi:hypothetical protein
LKNVFDQYSQAENRVTHALITALDQDRASLASFLKELVKVWPPGHPKQYPGEAEPSERPERTRRMNDVGRKLQPEIGWMRRDDAAIKKCEI